MAVQSRTESNGSLTASNRCRMTVTGALILMRYAQLSEN